MAQKDVYHAMKDVVHAEEKEIMIVLHASLDSNFIWVLALRYVEMGRIFRKMNAKMETS